MHAIKSPAFCFGSCFCLLLLGSSGCGGPSLPEVTPASGVVMLRGKPLPNALVVFVPSMRVESKSIAAAETDDEGRYELVCGEEKGAYVCEHTVTIREGGLPPELLREDKQTELAAYLNGLKNRPIPKLYGSPVTSPLKVTVTPDQSVYDLELQ